MNFKIGNVYRHNIRGLNRKCVSCHKDIAYKSLYIYDGINFRCALCGDEFLKGEIKKFRIVISRFKQSLKKIPDKEKVVQRLSYVKI
jgi:predicted RNA-binding Zn-ribbon protein involved in translation (DUF1610 family)